MPYLILRTRASVEFTYNEISSMYCCMTTVKKNQLSSTYS